MIMHNIDGVEIPLDHSWKSIAISVSGGADSALLAFLLCSLIKNQEVHIISHIRMWKTRPWQIVDSKKVFEWLEKRFPKVKFHRHTNFIAPDIEYGNSGPIIKDEYGKMVSGDNTQIRAFAEYICFRENIDAYYNAVTRNPRNVNFRGMKERDIDPNEENKYLAIMKHMERWAIHPFRFVEKDWVVKQYIRLEIIDLFEITRSCEGEFKNINYHTYTAGQYVPLCGNCFWCKEREWAVEQNK